MKTTGIILTILSFFSFIGCLNSGMGLTGPTLMLATGIFLIYRANKKKEDALQEQKGEEERNATENN